MKRLSRPITPLTPTLNRRRLVGFWLVILLVLNLGNALAVHLLFVRKLEFGLGVVPLFNFDGESNLPTLFNGLLLGFGGVVAFGISSWIRAAGGVGRDRRAWFGIAMILGFMMLDELCQLHESVDWILMARVEMNGAVSWPWVIPYAVLALAVAGFFLKFFFSLQRRYQVVFALAAGIYVTGALGFEMLEAAHTEKHGMDSLGFGILYSIEETLEMLAVILANWGIMTYAVEECEGLKVGFSLE